MANQFDDFTKGLAAASSRRAALKVIGIGAVGAAAGVFTLFRGGTAEARRGGCLAACRGKRGESYRSCVQVCTCRESGGHICGEGSGRVCCPPWTRCSSLIFTPTSAGDDDLDDTDDTVGNEFFCVPIPADGGGDASDDSSEN